MYKNVFINANEKILFADRAIKKKNTTWKRNGTTNLLFHMTIKILYLSSFEDKQHEFYNYSKIKLLNALYVN